jgi:molybdenum cofactor sulfurtransferase
VDIIACPQCGAAAEVEWYATVASTAGPVTHVKLRCVNRHWYLLPAEDVAATASTEARFHAGHPDFDPDGRFARLRRTEYGRLDDAEEVYLDYTGGSLYASSQLEAHMARLRGSVLGNPHSANPTSRASTTLVDTARRAVCEFFRAPPDEYACIFTANASAALRLLGEAYPFAPGSTYALTVDNHNSVNGIREFARSRGAAVQYVPIVAPELRVDRAAMRRTLTARDAGAHSLLAFPAQSNFSGVQHPLELVAEAHDAGWDVVLDAAAFAPTNRLDVGRVRPDFVSLSFYKIMGYPTGLGCLLARRDRLAHLRRPWFAGGTVLTASVLGDGFFLRPDEGGFEDGTVDYLSLPAVASGLEYIEQLGLDAIHRRVRCLTGWLLDALVALLHSNGSRVVRILGPESVVARGGTVTFTVHDVHGRPVDDRRVERLASQERISVRTGCFCNPGAGEVAFGLEAAPLRALFASSESLSETELRSRVLAEQGRFVSAVRASLGVASNFADAERLVCFLAGFRDRTVADIGGAEGGIACFPRAERLS